MGKEQQYEKSKKRITSHQVGPKSTRLRDDNLGQQKSVTKDTVEAEGLALHENSNEQATTDPSTTTTRTESSPGPK